MLYNLKFPSSTRRGRFYPGPQVFWVIALFIVQTIHCQQWRIAKSLTILLPSVVESQRGLNSAKFPDRARGG